MRRKKYETGQCSCALGLAQAAGRTIFGLVALCFAFGCAESAWRMARADEKIAATSIPVSVSSVTSGGYWKTKADRGRYRAIVEEGGWEHVKSRVQIEWLAEKPAKKSIVVISTAVVSELEGWRVARLSIEPTRTGSLLHVWGAATDGEEQKITFALAEPGRYRQVR